MQKIDKNQKAFFMNIHYLHFETLASTQKWAKEHVQELSVEELSCISTEEQTEGIGRRGSRWFSPKKTNLYVTFVFSLPMEAKNVLCLSHLGIVTLAEVLLQERVVTEIIPQTNN